MQRKRNLTLSPLKQVSGQAAASIRSKFTALFPTTHPAFPTPAQVLATDLSTLRTAGLSQRKAEYIHGLAGKFAAGDLTAEMLVGASDEKLVDTLVAVRGLGRWSVDMFMLFTLKRMDVFSTGDLGVQYVFFWLPLPRTLPLPLLSIHFHFRILGIHGHLPRCA